MKYTGIELLQAIKEEKFEKDTKFLCVDWKPTNANNNVYFNSEGILKWEVSNNSLTQEVLIKYHFEVIEEKPKKIEELKIEQIENNPSCYYIKNEYGTKCCLTKHSKIIAEKVNELQKAVNYLLEKESDK